MSIEQELIELLIKKQLKITTAESCTGGMIGSMLVNVSGASNVYEYGFITYSDNAKHNTLGVNLDSLARYTAVSDVVAREMATGALLKSGADISVSITGYAGPYDSIEEPKGLVYIGCAYHNDVVAYECHFDGDRQTIRENAAKKALEIIKNTITKKET